MENLTVGQRMQIADLNLAKAKTELEKQIKEGQIVKELLRKQAERFEREDLIK